jgi:hypothetical protein
MGLESLSNAYSANIEDAWENVANTGIEKNR